MKKLIVSLLGMTLFALLFSTTAFAHTVKSGDTLFGIAQSHNLTLEQIAKLNPQIEDLNLIFVDDEIETDISKLQSKVETQLPPSTNTETNNVLKPANVNSNNPDWQALAKCESGGNPSIISSNGLYHGLYQFNIETWQGVGGTGLPSQVTVEEQTKRAKILYNLRGSQPWPYCGRFL